MMCVEVWGSVCGGCWSKFWGWCLRVCWFLLCYWVESLFFVWVVVGWWCCCDWVWVELFCDRVFFCGWSFGLEFWVFVLLVFFVFVFVRVFLGGWVVVCWLWLCCCWGIDWWCFVWWERWLDWVGERWREVCVWVVVFMWDVVVVGCWLCVDFWGLSFEIKGFWDIEVFGVEVYFMLFLGVDFFVFWVLERV